MDLKGLVDKAKAAIKGNPSLIDKGGEAVNKATGGKYTGHVDKAQDAVKKAVGVDETPAPNAAPQPSADPVKPEPPKQDSPTHEPPTQDRPQP